MVFYQIPFGLSVAKRILLGKHLKDGYGACPTCSQMARLSTYKIVSGFDSKFRRGEDTDLIIRLAINGTHFIGIQEALVEQTMTISPDKSVDIDFKYISEKTLFGSPETIIIGLFFTNYHVFLNFIKVYS